MAGVQNISLTAPTDYEAEKQALDRQRQMAQLLSQQGMQPLDTNQMAGGYVVPVSPFQGLAKMLQSYSGAAGMRQADEKQRMLANQRQSDISGDYTKLAEALTGKPATPQVPDAEIDPAIGMGQQAAPAVAPGVTLEMLKALRTPEAQSMALGMMRPKEPIKLGKDDRLLNPATYQQMVGPSAPQPKFHVVGGNLVQEPTAPGAPVAPAFTAPEKPIKTPADDLKAVLTAAGIDPNSKEAQALFKAQAMKLATHQPSASNNVTIKQEGAEAQTVGKSFGEQFNKIQEAGVAANTKLSKLDRMKNLLDGVDTGKLTPMGTEVAALADSLGIKIDKNLGNKQAATALSSEMALELRNPSGGAGMPGAMSDQDRNYLSGMTPGIAKTPEGNRLIMDAARKLAKRDQEVAKLARDYRQKNGHMDEGFYNVLQQFSDANPLFPPTTQGGSPSAKTPSAVDAALQKYLPKGR